MCSAKKIIFSIFFNKKKQTLKTESVAKNNIKLNTVHLNHLSTSILETLFCTHAIFPDDDVLIFGLCQ